MAIIDLRHLIEPECDVIEFIGNEDKQLYKLPIRKTMGMSLMLTAYMREYSKDKDVSKYDIVDNIECGYFMIAAWIRGFYPDKSVEWVKANVLEELFTELLQAGNKLFFPKQKATAQPKKARKRRKS